MSLNFKRVVDDSCGGLCFEGLKTLQINVGNRCNLRCKHCHVDASPEGNKIMNRDVIDKIAKFLDKHDQVIADITGGCPELNPNFKFLMERLCDGKRTVMVRTNLSVLLAPEMQWIPKWYSGHNVIIVASLPCYTKDNVDNQRGNGTFDKSIKAISMLNDLGYGRDGGGILNLVYNPGGAFLPGDQKELESEYKRHLLDEHEIIFNNLFTITNCPIGRFRQQLNAKGQFYNYLKLLAGNFNEAAARNVMCRQLLSVDYKGLIYNCDFNQALNMPVTDTNGNPVTINTIDNALETSIGVTTGDYCFSCTAGAGSSCTGEVVNV